MKGFFFEEKGFKKVSNSVWSIFYSYVNQSIISRLGVREDSKHARIRGIKPVYKSNFIFFPSLYFLLYLFV